MNQEISNKRKLVRTTKQNLTSMKDVLHHEMYFIDFVHVTTIFLVSNDKSISKLQKTHGKNLYNLFYDNYYDNSVMSHDADKVIFNFSSHVLTDHEKSLLSKGQTLLYRLRILTMLTTCYHLSYCIEILIQ